MAKKPTAAEAVVEPGDDVAISFLAADEKIAEALATRLIGLKVFYFPDRQEDLAGTDGLETMRAPFLKARVNVVLYREQWGKTKWTAVEEAAIKDRCFDGGWPSLMFVMLDKNATPPKWLPKPYVRFNLEDYGIEQLVGAIKSKVQENGGRIERPDAMAEARRVQVEAAYLKDREHLMRDRRWIETVVHRALEDTMKEIIRLVDKANAEHGFNIQRGADGRSCALRTNGVSVGIGWKQPIFNLVCDSGSDECYLRVAEFAGTILLPGERGWVMDRPQQIKEHKFKVEVSPSHELVWIEVGKKDRVQPRQLPDRIVQIFLGLVSRANQGKVPRPELE
jgi:hypothetical protein